MATIPTAATEYNSRITIRTTQAVGASGGISPFPRSAPHNRAAYAFAVANCSIGSDDLVEEDLDQIDPAPSS